MTIFLLPYWLKKYTHIYQGMGPLQPLHFSPGDGLGLGGHCYGGSKQSVQIFKRKLNVEDTGLEQRSLRVYPEENSVGCLRILGVWVGCGRCAEVDWDLHEQGVEFREHAVYELERRELGVLLWWLFGYSISYMKRWGLKCSQNVTWILGPSGPWALLLRPMVLEPGISCCHISL